MDTQQRIEAIEALTTLLSLLYQTNSDRELIDHITKKLSDLVKSL